MLPRPAPAPAPAHTGARAVLVTALACCALTLRPPHPSASATISYDRSARSAATVASVASVLSAASASTITLFPTHPRLIIGGYRGASLAELRAVCARPELRGACDRIGGRHVLDDAMRWLLMGEASAADQAVARLNAWTGCAEGAVEHSDAGGWALAYDWLYEWLSPAERRRASERLTACGRSIVASLEGNGPHLWHGYTALAGALALAALAADPEDPADSLLPAAELHFRRRSLEAYALVGGAWPEGYNYERSHFFSADPPEQYVMDALRAWDSAVAADSPRHDSLFATIAQEEGDWLRGLAWHLVYGSMAVARPDGRLALTLLRGGDMPTGQAWPNKQYRPFVDSIARVYGEPGLAAWGRRVEQDWGLWGGEGSYHSIHLYSLPYNLPTELLDGLPADAADAWRGLPPARIWSREDLGYVISRSGFGDDATLVGYRAGKWLTGHQHLDQGHLDLWHRGALALDAGVYAAWGTEHREGYYLRAVAHNTLLIHRDGEDFEEHPGSGLNLNDDGQRIHTYNRRGCPQCLQSVAEWRQHIGAGMHLEAGRIEAYEDAAAYTRIASDLTGAYNSVRYSTPGNSPKVERVQRDLVYLRPGRLLVLDRVVTTAGSGPPRFTLHLPARPELSGAAVMAGTAEDGILETSESRFTVRNSGQGELRMATLWPREARLTAIGGSGHRYWVDGANRAGGAAGLEGSPAEPGLWRIEAAPAVPEHAQLLVHALAVGDAGETEDPASDARLLPVDSAGTAAGTAVLWSDGTAPAASWLVLASGAVPRAPLVFGRLELDAAEAGLQTLLTDLDPAGGAYRVALDGRLALDRTASVEGVLKLDVPAGGRELVFGACPAPGDAAAPWRALCALAGGEPSATVGPSPAATATPEGATATRIPTGPPTGTAEGDRCYLPRLTR